MLEKEDFDALCAIVKEIIAVMFPQQKQIKSEEEIDHTIYEIGLEKYHSNIEQPEILLIDT